jgi:hypothetical protein
LAARFGGRVSHYLNRSLKNPGWYAGRRFDNVRKTDSEMVAGVIDALVAGISIGLLGACGSLNDEAEERFEKFVAINAAIALVQNPDHTHPGIPFCANSRTPPTSRASFPAASPVSF